MTKSTWKFVRIALVVAATSGCAGTRPRGTFVSEQPGRAPGAAPSATSNTASHNATSSASDSIPTKTRILREVPLEGAFAPPASSTPRPVAVVDTPALVARADGTGPVGPGRVIPVDGEVVRGRNPLVENLLSDDAELRIATLQVIRDAIRDGFDFADDQPDAEGVNLIVTLRWMAYGYEQDGTWIEPVDAIRAAAMAALVEADPSPASLAFNRPFCVDDALLPAQAAEVLTADTNEAFPPQGTATETLAASDTPDSPAVPDGSVGRLGSEELRQIRQGDEAPQITPKSIPLDDPASEELELVGSVPSDGQEMPSSAQEAHEIQISAGPRRREVDLGGVPAADTTVTETSEVLPELNDSAPTEGAITASESATSPTEPEITPSETAATANGNLVTLPEPVVEPTTPETTVGSVATDEPRMKAPTEAETARKTIPIEDSSRVEPEIAHTPSSNDAPIEQPRAEQPRAERRVPVVTTPARSTNVPEPVDMTEPVPYVAAKGVICRVDTAGGTAEIRLYGTEASVPVGARFVVVHRYPLGKLSSMGEVEVIATRAGVVQVRPVGGTPLSKVAVGDRASTTATY